MRAFGVIFIYYIVLSGGDVGYHNYFLPAPEGTAWVVQHNCAALMDKRHRQFLAKTL